MEILKQTSNSAISTNYTTSNNFTFYIIKNKTLSKLTTILPKIFLMLYFQKIKNRKLFKNLIRVKLAMNTLYETLLIKHNNPNSRLSFSLNGDYLGVSDIKNSYIFIANPLAKKTFGRQIYMFSSLSTKEVIGNCFSPNTDMFAIGNIDKIVIYAILTLKLKDAQKKKLEQKPIIEIAHKNEKFNSFCFSPNGELLVIGGSVSISFYGVNAFDKKYFKKIITKININKSVNSICYSLNLEFFGCGCDGGKIIIYGINQEEFIKKPLIENEYKEKDTEGLDKDGTPVKSVCFSSDVKYFAAAHVLYSVIYGVNTLEDTFGKVIYRINHAQIVNVNCFSYHNCFNNYSVGDSTGCVVTYKLNKDSVKSFGEEISIKQFKGEIKCLSYSFNNYYMAVGSVSCADVLC